MLKNILIILIFTLQSCTTYQVDEEPYLFDVDEELAYPDFLEDGYERVIVDVLLFEKTKNDTTIQLSFYYDLDDIKVKRWYFKAPTRKKEWVYDLLNNYDLQPVSNISKYTSNYLLEDSSAILESLHFVAKHHTTRNIYICALGKLEEGDIKEGKFGEDYLLIQYYYPKKISFFEKIIKFVGLD